MNLDDTQKETIKSWISEGLSIAEIQNKMAEELSVKSTYMEVRFLVDDLGAQIPEPEPEETVEETPEASTLSEENDLPNPGAPPTDSNVSVTLDSIAHPGALASGKVTFGDGKSASWTLDQMGRLGITPEEEGYKPSQEDAMAFQVELQNTLKRSGF